MLDFKVTKEKLNQFLDHINQRHSVCDLVDDKDTHQIECMKDIWNLCEQISKRMEKIYANP
jgi:ribosome-binding ATPase YchF (GTP1/OBG family)